MDLSSPTASYFIVPLLNLTLVLASLFLAFQGVKEIPGEKLERTPDHAGGQAWLRLVLTLALAGLMLSPLNIIANHLTAWFLQPTSPPEMKYSLLLEGLAVIGILGWMYGKFKRGIEDKG